jgi:subfamily B ATP-binding cassette protein MsbA
MKVFWRFFKYLKPYVKPLATANFFMLLFVIFSLASIGLVMPFIDLLFNQTPESLSTDVSFSIFNLKEWLTYQLNQFVQSYSKQELITYLCFLIVIVFIFKNLFAYLQTWFMSIVEQGIIRDIRLQLYSHFHKLSLAYFTEEKKAC